jgi:hypothetical protein
VSDKVCGDAGLSSSTFLYKLGFTCYRDLVNYRRRLMLASWPDNPCPFDELPAICVCLPLLFHPLSLPGIITSFVSIILKFSGQHEKNLIWTRSHTGTYKRRDRLCLRGGGFSGCNTSGDSGREASEARSDELYSISWRSLSSSRIVWLISSTECLSWVRRSSVDVICFRVCKRVMAVAKVHKTHKPAAETSWLWITSASNHT